MMGIWSAGTEIHSAPDAGPLLMNVTDEFIDCRSKGSKEEGIRFVVLMSLDGATKRGCALYDMIHCTIRRGGKVALKKAGNLWKSHYPLQFLLYGFPLLHQGFGASFNAQFLPNLVNGQK
jgi:hypothetical protein